METLSNAFVLVWALPLFLSIIYFLINISFFSLEKVFKEKDITTKIEEIEENKELKKEISYKFKINGVEFEEKLNNYRDLNEGCDTLLHLLNRYDR